MALYAIGEALIDFVPSRSGKPAADMHYTPAVGGAPLNVAAAYAKLGGKSYILSQVGDDAFGAQIAATAEAAGVDTRYLKHSRAAKTALAFVTLYDSGEREFAFYRDPSADMLYAPENLADITLQAGDILHYCSVSLVPCPMREAHRAAIAKFRAAGAAISFDINLRLPLWKNPADLYAAVHEFLPLADIIKISDDELAFVTGESDPARGIPQLFRGHVKFVAYTCGANGAAIYDKNGERGRTEAYRVNAVDATGAGDAFIGGLLVASDFFGLVARGDLAAERIQALLDHAAKVGAITTLGRGAIDSMPDLERLHAFRAEKHA